MFKRRNIIAFILTIAIVALLNKYWLFFKPNHSLPQFNFYILIILLILIYLLMYKLTDYIADFKTVKKYSRIDIIFATIFFIFLFIPMSNIQKDEISEQENRTLAEWKPFIENNKINYDFGKNFNEWYNDRFYLRDILNNSYDKIEYFLSGDIYANEKAVYNKKTKWCFVKYHLFEAAMRFKTYESKQNILNNLIKFNEFCESHNMKLYVLVVPTAADIYGEHAGFFYSKKYEENVKQLTDLLQHSKDLNTIYPFLELMKEKNNGEYVYYKQDMHWTQYGAYISYKKLMEEIKKDFPNVKIQNLSDYNIYYSQDVISTSFENNYHAGGTMHFFPFIKQDKEIEYKYYANKDIKNLSVNSVEDYMKRQQTYFYPKGTDLRVVQLGTSMNKSLLNYTSYTFKNLKHFRINGIKGIDGSERFKIMKYYKDEILNYKPDIIIFCITISNLGELTDIFKE